MKKLVFNKKAVFFLASIVLLTAGSAKNIFAQTPLEYYKSLFISWGIKVDTITETVTTDTETKNKEAALGTQETLAFSDTLSSDKNSFNSNYLLVLSSQSGVVTSRYNNVIYICDTDTTEVKVFDCSSNTLNGINLLDTKTLESSQSFSIIKIIEPIVLNNTTYYVIPRVLITSPQYQEIVAGYFEAISRANLILQKDNRVEENSFLEAVVNIRGSSLFEGTIYVFVILVIILLLKNLLITIAADPKKLLEKSYYKILLKHPLAFLRKYRDIFAFIFLILFIFYLLIIYSLTIKGQLLGDPLYLTNYFISSFDAANFPVFILSKNIFRLSFLIYNFLLFIFAACLLLPSLLALLNSSLTKFKAVKIRLSFVKWSIPALLFVASVILSFFNLTEVISLLSLLIVAVLTALYYIKNRNIKYSDLFSKTELVLTIIFLTIPILIGVVYPSYKGRLPVNYSFEPLIGVQDRVVVFPYSKKWGENTLFRPQYYTGNSRVYADDYLVYAPNVKKIVNKPLSEFKNVGNYIIEVSELDKYLSTLLNYPELKTLATKESFSTIFLINNSDKSIDSYAGLRTTVTFNCSGDAEPGTLEFAFSSLGDSLSIEKTKSDILNFPGCSGNNTLEKIEVPIDLRGLPQKEILVTLQGIDMESIANLEILTPVGKIPITFINNTFLSAGSNVLLYSQNQRADLITLYSNRIEKNLVIDIVTTEKGFDLSNPINELIKSKALKNPFVIWSEKPNEVIKVRD